MDELAKEVEEAAAEGSVRLLGLLETLGAEDPLGALAYCCPPFLTQARSKLQHEADGGQEEGEWEEVLPAVTQTVASLVLEGLGYTPPATDVLIPRGLPLEGLHHGLELLRELCRWPASREALLLLSPSREEEVLTPVLLSLMHKAPTHTAIRAMAVARALSVGEGWREVLGTGGAVQACITRMRGSAGEAEGWGLCEEGVGLLHGLAFHEQNAHTLLHTPHGLETVLQVLQRALSSEEGSLPSCCQCVGVLYFMALDLLALLTSPPSHTTADLHLPSLPDILHTLVSCVDRHVLHPALSESCGEEEEAAKGDLVVACLGFLRTLTLHTHTLVEVAHGVAVEVLVSLLQCVLMHPRQSDGEAASDALEVLLRILLDEECCEAALMGSDGHGDPRPTLLQLRDMVQAAAQTPVTAAGEGEEEGVRGRAVQLCGLLDGLLGGREEWAEGDVVEEEGGYARQAWGEREAREFAEQKREEELLAWATAYAEAEGEEEGEGEWAKGRLGEELVQLCVRQHKDNERRDSRATGAGALPKSNTSSSLSSANKRRAPPSEDPRSVAGMMKNLDMLEDGEGLAVVLTTIAEGVAANFLLSPPPPAPSSIAATAKQAARQRKGLKAKVEKEKGAEWGGLSRTQQRAQHAESQREEQLKHAIAAQPQTVAEEVARVLRLSFQYLLARTTFPQPDQTQRKGRAKNTPAYQASGVVGVRDVRQFLQRCGLFTRPASPSSSPTSTPSSSNRGHTRGASHGSAASVGNGKSAKSADKTGLPPRLEPIVQCACRKFAGTGVPFAVFCELLMVLAKEFHSEESAVLALAYLAKSLDRYLHTLQQKNRGKGNHAGAGDETHMHGQEHDWREMPEGEVVVAGEALGPASAPSGYEWRAIRHVLRGARAQTTAFFLYFSSTVEGPSSPTDDFLSRRRMSLPQLQAFCRSLCLCPGLMPRRHITSGFHALAAPLPSLSSSSSSSLNGSRSSAAPLPPHRRRSSLSSCASSSACLTALHASPLDASCSSTSTLDSSAPLALDLESFLDLLLALGVECEYFRRRDESADAPTRVARFLHWLDTSPISDRIYRWAHRAIHRPGAAIPKGGLGPAQLITLADLA